MIAQRWRKVLLGKSDTIKTLRCTNIQNTVHSSYNEDIHLDLVRTYPTDKWFTKHTENLSNILNLYAYTNNGMGYAQGMAFIVFILYKNFYIDDPKYACQDTFYSFHKIVNIIRPIYPINESDTSSTEFQDHLKFLIFFKISRKNRELALKLKQLPDLMSVIIYNNIPCLFANKFSVEESILLYDFIFVGECSEMFHRVICILCGIIISFEPIILSFTFDKVLEIMSVKDYYNSRKVLSIAYDLI